MRIGPARPFGIDPENAPRETGRPTPGPELFDVDGEEVDLGAVKVMQLRHVRIVRNRRPAPAEAEVRSSCDARVEVAPFDSCTSPATARYRIDVTGSGLMLVSDDGGGSPSGAFLDFLVDDRG
jgi:hypothetical protein